MNYPSVKIYKIWSPLGDKIYIGATNKKYLSNRMSEHRYAFLNQIKKTTAFILFQEYGIKNCFIELIELCSCDTKTDKNAKEGHYIRTLNCVNKNIPNRSIEELKEIRNIKNKNYRDSHK